MELDAAAAASTKNKKNGGPSGNNELKILWIFQLFSRWWPRASNSFIDPEAADAAMYTFAVVEILLLAREKPFGL